MRQEIKQLILAKGLVLVSGWLLCKFGIAPINRIFLNLNEKEAMVFVFVLLLTIVLVSHPMAWIITRTSQLIFPLRKRTINW